MSFRARENHVRVENYVQNVIANYSAEDFQRIYRLSHNCVEELFLHVTTVESDTLNKSEISLIFPA
jgi:hypothetical protein